eukprot:scaffold186467_cov22-Tisochrysis_lutea.AAC.1
MRDELLKDAIASCRGSGVLVSQVKEAASKYGAAQCKSVSCKSPEQAVRNCEAGSDDTMMQQQRLHRSHPGTLVAEAT